MELKYLGDQDLDKLGHPDKALKAYDDAIEINPQDPEVWYKKSIFIH
jgi:tetratricopeptide (TPR) repeat protein